MTNEYGSDSQPQENNHEEHDANHEPAAHEGEPAVWTDDQPPHDDFESANEETATVSQEAATESEHEETAVPEQRQSRSMLPILAGLGGIVLLGGVLYLQFGHSSSPPMRLAATQNPADQAVPAALPTTSSTTTNSAEADIGALYKPAGSTAPATMPPSSTAIETTPSPLPSPLPPPKSEIAATSPKSSIAATSPETTAKSPSSAATTGTNAKIPAMPQVNPTNPVPPMPGQVLNPQPLNLPPAASEHADAQQMSRLNSLSARIDTLQKSLDQMTNMVAAMPGTTSHPNSDVENRLNRIEQTLTKIENDQAAKGTRMASASPAVSTEETSPAAHSAKKVSSSRHKHHAKPAPVSHHRAISTGSVSAKATSRSPWVLRAATPKEAWVSTDATSPDLRHIQIGESLSGIGTVRSIRQINGGWEIEGSTGIIR